MILTTARQCTIYRLFIILPLFFLGVATTTGVANFAIAENQSNQIIDLSSITPQDNLARNMFGFSILGEDTASLGQRLKTEQWLRTDQYESILKAPREHSTLWLRSKIENSSNEHIRRWIEFAPWRLNKIDAWYLDTDTLEVKRHVELGLNVPIENREVEKKHAIVPVALGPKESFILVIRIYSDSRPFLRANSWDPVDFTIKEMAERQFHSILMSSIITLFIVLVVRLDLRYFLLGTWILTTFIFESEKEGYISQVIFSSLFDYSANIRFSTWILNESLFLVVSAYLLGISHMRGWRLLTPVVFIISSIFSALTFLLDGALLRNLGITIDLGFSLIWILMIPTVLRAGCRWQYSSLSVLSIWWLSANFVLTGYILNINYTASFSSVKIVTEIGVIILLLLIYSRQKRSYQKNLEEKLRNSEKEQRAKLEDLVRQRTHELNVALDSAHNANAGKAMFLARISHDLKSPLTSIIGYAQLLGAESGRPGEYGRTIYKSAFYMRNLINRLTGYATGVADREVRRGDMHVNNFFSSVKHEADILVIKNNNRFSMSVSSSEFPVVRCDEVSLRQIVINLIDNSAKYTRSGIVSLDVQCFPLGEKETLGLALTIKDTGRGISSESQARLFEPFFRGGRTSEGVGLGLPIVRDLVTAMDGEISLVSEEGVGTEIRLLIPVDEGDESGLLEGDSYTLDSLLPTYQARGLSAWVVEDLPPVLDFLCGDLSDMGFDVKGFQNGKDAISAFTRLDEVPDLVVTDYRLQDTSGDEVLVAAKKNCVDTQVMLVSATWDVLKERSLGSDLTYSSFIKKPIDLAGFRREVARVCNVNFAVPADHEDIGALAAGNERPDIQRLEEFLKLGAVSDILDWCDTFSAAYPNRDSLVAKLREHAECGNFSAIKEEIKCLF